MITFVCFMFLFIFGGLALIAIESHFVKCPKCGCKKYMYELESKIHTCLNCTKQFKFYIKDILKEWK